MGVFDHLHTMLTAGRVTQLVISQDAAGAAPPAELAVIRSSCGGTLSERITQLETMLSPHREAIRAGRVATAQFLGDEDDLGKLSALKYVATQIRQQGSMLSRDAITLVRDKRLKVLGSVNLGLAADQRKPIRVPNWPEQMAGNELLARLPLLRVPLGTFGSDGGAENLLMPIVPGIVDAELLDHIELVKEVRLARAAAAQPHGTAFETEKYQLVIDALPPSARATVHYLLIKLAGAEVGRDLGLSQVQMDTLVARFDKACSETLPAAMRKAEASILADLARRANVTEAQIAVACSSRARLARYRTTVKEQHVLRDHRLVTAQKLEQRCPLVLELLRVAVAANTDVSYKLRDTPIDKLIVDKEQLRGAGGQKQRFARFLNMVLASHGMLNKVSASLIPRLAREAGIISAGVLKVKDPAKIGTVFCAHNCKVQRQVNYLLSTYSQRVGLDQMKLLKCNTDANTRNMTGNRTLYQLEDERAMTHSKGVGGDHLAKFGLESILLETTREGSVAFPDGFDLRKFVPMYNPAKFCRMQPALAHMYVHVQEREPESAFRDFADLSEFVSRFPHRFVTPELKPMPFYFLERDNAHGVGTLETRFCVVLFAVLHGAYYVGIVSQEAGQSRKHRVEMVNGVGIRAITGSSFDVPMNVPDRAPDSVKRPAQDAVQQQIVEKFPVTFKWGDAEDGFVSAEKPRSTALACGFEWRTAELGAFVDAAKKSPDALHAFVADESNLKPMPQFVHPLGYAGVLQLVWRLLNVPGALSCTKLTAHTFEYKFNPLNVGCPPPDPESQEAVAVLEAILRLDGLDGERAADAKGDGYLPQARPAHAPERRVALKYADLAEVLTRGGATAPDEFYPKHMLDERLAREPELLKVFTRNHNSLPPPLLKELTEWLVVDELALYSDLAERVAKEEYAAVYEAMKTRQAGDGTNEYVAAIVEGLLGKPADATAAWPRVTELKKVITDKLPGKAKVPQRPLRGVLIQLIAQVWRNLPEASRPALPFARTAAPAAAAPAQTPAAAPSSSSLPSAALPPLPPMFVRMAVGESTVEQYSSVSRAMLMSTRRIVAPTRIVQATRSGCGAWGYGF